MAWAVEVLRIILGIAITNCQPASIEAPHVGRGCCQQRCDAAAMRAIKSVYAKTGRAFSARVPEEPLPRLTALHWDRGAREMSASGTRVS
jgi:hypothetical protein